MKIKSIVMKNLRSYKDAEIQFPDGSVLLAGDIGTGKTSVLLALEFALFGLQRGAGIGGAALLRAGETQAYVKAVLDIDGKEIILERNLKKSKTSIVQDTGFITIDGERHELSASELKGRILELLNYPAEFLTKTDLLYRFTIYAPQEEMKQILLENADLRLDTLRKVFGIDKYRNKIKNIDAFCAHLREIIRTKEGQTLDLEKKKNELKELEHSLVIFRKSEEQTAKEYRDAKLILEVHQDELKKFEEQIQNLNKIKTEIERKKAEIEAVSEQLVETIRRAQVLTEQVREMRETAKELKKEGIELVELASAQAEKELTSVEAERLRIEKELSSLMASRREKDSMKVQVQNLDMCPVCYQKVSAEHKHDFIARNDTAISDIDLQLAKLQEKKKTIDGKFTELKMNLALLQKQAKDVATVKIKLEQLRDKETELERMQKEKERLQARHDAFKNELKELADALRKFSMAEEDYKKERMKFSESQQKEKEIAIQKAKIEKSIETTETLLRNAQKDIAEKEKIKADAEYLINLKSWLQEKFVVLLESIEHAVMLRVHAEFLNVFEKWLLMLVQDIQVRLDEKFTPVIENRGYEISYEFLSGGERTAVALAYRLALNQVINGLLSRIKTRDLLILDEPTDGFSEQQLDKMRDVLQELKVKQLIIVSHESKIENFVSNIIRFKKDGGVTVAL